MKKLLALSILTTSVAASMQAHAFQFDTSDDWTIRWDNTAKGNLMMRVENQDPSVYDPGRAQPSLASALADDADYSVDEGHFVSQRFDLLSEMDVVWKDKLGFRISGAGWYDFAYGGDNDAPTSGPTKGYPAANSTWGALSVQPGEYTDKAEDLSYRGGELLDAFVFANFEIGSASANLRVGRHTLYWGQSLLSLGAIHGFAGSMAALDLSKGLGTPGSEAKELFLPNNKISTSVQFSDKLTISAFYALEFVPLRWPEYGTYFSLNETSAAGSEFITAAAGTETTARQGFRMNNYKSKDSGDWGVNVQYFIEPWDLETAFIYMNNTDRLTSGIYSVFDGVRSPKEAELIAQTNAQLFGHYGWVYKDDIDTFGFSLSKEMLDISWGADFVYRNNNAIYLDLQNSLFGAAASAADVNTNSKYPGPTGDTVHIVLNGVGFLSPDWGLWDGGAYAAEITFSRLLHFGENENKASTLVESDEWTSTVSGRFKPTWYQVRAGWDLSMPSSLSYSPKGRQAPNTAGGNEKVGNGNLGLELDIEQTWTATLSYNFYYGPQKNGPAAYIKDRDNISFTVKRTF